MTAGGEGRAGTIGRWSCRLPRASWSPENLGDQLNELAASLGLRAHVHRRTPRRWVYGDPGWPGPCVPREPWPLLVCQLLHERLGEPVSLAALGWGTVGALQYVPADGGLDRSWNQRGSGRAGLGSAAARLIKHA